MGSVKHCSKKGGLGLYLIDPRSSLCFKQYDVMCDMWAPRHYTFLPLTTGPRSSLIRSWLQTLRCLLLSFTQETSLITTKWFFCCLFIQILCFTSCHTKTQFIGAINNDLSINHHAQSMNPKIFMVVSVTLVVVPTLPKEFALSLHHLVIINSAWVV